MLTKCNYCKKNEICPFNSPAQTRTEAEQFCPYFVCGFKLLPEDEKLREEISHVIQRILIFYCRRAAGTQPWDL